MGVTSDREVTPDVGSYTSPEMISGARIHGKFVIAFVGSNHAKIQLSVQLLSKWRTASGGYPVSEVTPTYPTQKMMDLSKLYTHVLHVIVVRCRRVVYV